uniref:Uncharacterized protein n=1 Tax=Anguilla anguilla TaxID=7936 RepID=A0A0E9UBB5_ANGAN
MKYSRLLPGLFMIILAGIAGLVELVCICCESI